MFGNVISVNRLYVRELNEHSAFQEGFVGTFAPYFWENALNCRNHVKRNKENEEKYLFKKFCGETKRI